MIKSALYGYFEIVTLPELSMGSTKKQCQKTGGIKLMTIIIKTIKFKKNNIEKTQNWTESDSHQKQDFYFLYVMIMCEEGAEEEESIEW